MGQGKTTLVKEWLCNHYQNKKIIYVSMRHTLSSSLIADLNSDGRLNFIDYRNKQNVLNNKKIELGENGINQIVCQIESIYTKIANVNNVQLIIFDEFDSCLHHLNSSNIDTSLKLKAFIQLLKSPAQKIFMDAFL